MIQHPGLRRGVRVEYCTGSEGRKALQKGDPPCPGTPEVSPPGNIYAGCLRLVPEGFPPGFYKTEPEKTSIL